MTVSESADPRSELFEGLEDAVERRVFPGCVALVWRDGETVYHEAHGRLASHPGSVAADVVVERDSVYDLASLTKVLCTSTLAAIAVGRGLLRLDDPVPAPFDRSCPGARLSDLLEHCAGLEAHREYFVDVPAGDRETLLKMVSETPPAYPLRERSVYSDLGFIILGTWLERIFDDTLDRAFERYVAQPSGYGGEWIEALRFRPIEDALIAPDEARRIAPTEVYDAGLHESRAEGLPSWFGVRSAKRRLAHGEVHDDNAYVMGGVAGHAGLFGNAGGVLAVARAWLDASLPGLESAQSARFWTKSRVPGSSRRLGWDGQSVDGSGSTGGVLEHGAVGHTGYTGTSLWIEPERRAVYVLLSNRVHPTRHGDGIRATRRWFHQVARKL
jgi:CubicO group peptidase (beta-lactamase class C family)